MGAGGPQKFLDVEAEGLHFILVICIFNSIHSVKVLFKYWGRWNIEEWELAVRKFGVSFVRS